MKVGVLGGTSLLQSNLFAHLTERIVETSHGKVIVYTSDAADAPVFIQRHHADATAGASVYHPPHLINFRANVEALHISQVSVIIAVCSVGSLTCTLPPGTLTVPDDYFSVFCPPYSLHDDARSHIVPGFDMNLRTIILSALTEEKIPNVVTGGATYVQLSGPRFETRAEIRFLSSCGDVIGMTGAHEATMAKELNIPYSAMAMIDNMANGLGGEDLTVEEFKANVKKNQTTVERGMRAVIERLQGMNELGDGKQ